MSTQIKKMHIKLTECSVMDAIKNVLILQVTETMTKDSPVTEITNQAITVSNSKSTTDLSDRNLIFKVLAHQFTDQNIDAKIPGKVCEVEHVLENIPDIRKENIPNNEAEEALEISLLEAQSEVKG